FRLRRLALGGGLCSDRREGVTQFVGGRFFVRGVACLHLLAGVGQSLVGNLDLGAKAGGQRRLHLGLVGGEPGQFPHQSSLAVDQRWRGHERRRLAGKWWRLTEYDRKWAGHSEQSRKARARTGDSRSMAWM